MDYQELKQIEDDLWEAADQLRANSKLTASEYSMPVLGLIFLRHATTRFNDLLPEVEKAVPARAKGALREDRLKLGFQGKAAIYFDCVTNYAFRARNTGIAAAFERFASPASVVAWRSSPAHAVAFARLPRGR